MDPEAFANDVEALYRELYRLAVRRVDDGRERLSAETTTLLGHLAQAGPSTLGELSLHFDRALSTMSAKVSSLIDDGLLARQRDEDDGRRSLIWLSPAGRDAYETAQRVLDPSRLVAAAERLPPDRRDLVVELLRELVDAFPRTDPRTGDHHGHPHL